LLSTFLIEWTFGQPGGTNGSIVQPLLLWALTAPVKLLGL